MLIKSCKNSHINCAIKEEKTLEPALFEEKEIETKPQELRRRSRKNSGKTSEKTAVVRKIKNSYEHYGRPVRQLV